MNRATARSDHRPAPGGNPPLGGGRDGRGSSGPRGRRALCLIVGALALMLLLAPAAPAQFVITEFMAANDTTLNDEDGDNSDWIEIHNEGTAAASLAGWYLTDAANDLRRWEFPATNVPPNGYIVVFASNKDRRTPGAPLHTDFRLSADGEYLALVRPDGVTIASEFRPAFPPQVDDVSYGIVRDTAAVTLVDTGAVARARVPGDGELGLEWTAVEFDDSTWAGGTTAVGYDRQTIGVNFLPLIGLNVEAMMFNVNQTIYVRVPFTVANPGDLSGLTLRMKFEDGFVAYLNGQEVARSNAPANPAWNSGALGPRTDTSATNFVDFDLTEFRNFLVAGANVLAFQALNNPTNSPDLLLLPQLVGQTPNGPAQARYFPAPTPGRANLGGVATLGPIISDAAHLPALPGDADAITVTARLRPAFGAVAAATLRYRVMFGAESGVAFLDDGAHGDGAAGDGVYGATIPAGVSAPGQMVRWYVTAVDTTGTNTSRLPPFTRPDAPAYFGTVIANPALTNPLPVFHWFVQDVAATDTAGGTRCAVFYGGEFYDNVFCRVRGASAPSFPKKPYKFDFNPGDHFRFLPGAPRMDEINLNTTYQDKAYVRAPLTFETYRRAGVPACDAFNVRVQQNNAFYSVAVLTEQVDETFLERRNLDPEGALYKMFNGINSAATGVEKKTRLNENNADLQQLVGALSLPGAARGTALFDLLDLPEIVNYLAAGTVAQDWDRAVKNIYLYRDTAGTGLWQMFPWDKDLSFGKVGLVNDAVTGIRDGTDRPGGGEPYISHPFYGIVEANCCGANFLFDAVYKTPVTRQMYLRRLRTLLDELLQPPGTPANELQYEARLDALFEGLRNDAALDLNRWGATYGVVQNLATAIAAIKQNYLAPRRTHLFQTHSVDNVGVYPQAVGIPHAQVGLPPLAFGTIEFNPASGNQAEEFVELLNPHPVAVDISGWRLEGGIAFTFRPGTVVPANGRMFVSPAVAAFRARASGPRGGQGLFVVGNADGRLSARGETLRLLAANGQGIATNTYAGAPSPAQEFLRITELMYHPSPLAGSAVDPEEFEYVELRNISGTATLNLSGVRFANGIDFGFTGGAVITLPPGGRVLVVKNLAAFTARYGTGFNVAGQYTGSLDNNGERLRLLDAAGEEILDFDFDDDWYPITDGLGFSLVTVDEAAPPDDWSAKRQWRPSGVLDGSPGALDPSPPAVPAVVINEVLTRTDAPPPTDSLEVFNPTPDAADLGGWFITDDFNTPKKFRVPPGTVVPAGGFLVFDESHFNPVPGVPPSFSFRSLGDEAWLFSGDAGTNLTGYVHGFAFGAAADGVSFGRHVNSAGEETFPAQVASTLGAANAGPRVGPVVIAEIMYHPPDNGAGGRREFIELQNLTAAPVSLFDPAQPANTWRLRGVVEFDFPTNMTLAGGAQLLLVGFDPVNDPAALANFRSTYQVDAGVPVLGPYAGELDDADGLIAIERPDSPNGATVPYLVVDAVRYRDRAPWPAADGTGSSLQRLTPDAYGNEPANWFAAGRTPGAPNILNAPPAIAITAPANGAVFSQPANIAFQVDAEDSDGEIAQVEYFANGLRVGQAGTAPFSFTWSNAPAGAHTLFARATDDRFAATDSGPVTITVLALPPTVALTSPTNGALLLANHPVTLAAAASDPDGFVSKVEFYDGAVRLGEVSVSPYVFTWTNPPAGERTLSAVATDNAGFTAASSPVLVRVVPGSATNLTLVATGAVWRYFDQGIDLGSAWRARDFPDGGWPSGPAPLGYGDNDEATTVGYGPNAASKHVTTYFRRAFAVANAPAFTALNLRVLRDDGAVVYLNGVEAFRTGMPDGPITFNTLANITVVGGDESVNFFSAAVDPALLVEGNNVLAVEIHQVQPSSSDISFDLELTGTQAFYAPVILAHPVSRAAPAGGTAAFHVQATGTPPLAYQWRFNGTNLPGANGPALVITDVQLAHSGSYAVVVSNGSGSATSQAALLGVTVGDDYGQTVLADGPIHFYRFEETSTAQPAADLGTPGGLNGTYTGGLQVNQPTAPLPLGRAARFNGDPGTFVSLGLFHPGNAVTIEAWVRLDADARPGSYHAIVARWDGSYELDIAPDERANFVVRNQANAFGLAASAAPLARDQWHHLAGVYSGGTLSLYVNGSLGGSVAFAGTLRNGGPVPDRVLIGGTRDGANASFNWKGLIDEVAIYNRALPPDRLFAHARAGLPAARLGISPAGVIVWPAALADHTLEATESLREPAVWSPDPAPRLQAGDYLRITVPLTATNRFYRLRQP